ncbi:MAG: hypothetical protein JXA54_03160 [Candidatus Heimdallarchaeota archaeon]|nr:hypothetical protein [Candidatus Heimdallarchaeota archaeon]
MNKAIYYKIMFILAGVWNLSAAIIFGILAPTVSGFLVFFGLSDDPAIYLWMYSFILMVAIFGFMYFLVGLDITKNHLVISTGMISKMSYFIILLIFFILGDCGLYLLLIAIVDLVFVGLFIEFFINFKKLESAQIAIAYAPYRPKSKKE